MVAHQQLRQSDAAPLAAGELAHRLLPVQSGQQAGGDVAHLRVGGPLVLGHVPDDSLPHRVGVDQHIGLVQESDADAAAPGDLPGVGLLLAGQQAHQRGFPVAVAAHDADPVPGVEPKVTSSRTVRVPKVMERFSAPSRCATRPVEVPLLDEDAQLVD